MVREFKENGGKSLVALEEKVKVSEVKLKEVEAESRAKEADMHKVYDLVNRLLVELSLNQLPSMLPNTDVYNLVDRLYD